MYLLFQVKMLLIQAGFETKGGQNLIWRFIRNQVKSDTDSNTTPDPESSLVKMSESGHFTVINLIKQCD